MWKNHIAFQNKSNLIGGQMKYQGFKQYHIEMYVATWLNYSAPKEILNNWYKYFIVKKIYKKCSCKKL